MWISIPKWLKRWLCWWYGHIEDISYGMIVSDDGKFISPVTTNTCKRCGYKKRWVDEDRRKPITGSYSRFQFTLTVPQIIKFD